MANIPRIKLGNCEILDVRGLFPADPNSPVGQYRSLAWISDIGIHHDAIAMPPGDQNYNGSTLDEDLERLAAVYHYHKDTKGWGGIAYQMMASPNNRAFLTGNLDQMGATVAKRNHQVLGIALMGNFQFNEPGNIELCAASRCVVYMWQQMGRFVMVSGHKELALPSDPTACPGNTWPVDWRDRLVRSIKWTGDYCKP